MRVYPVYWVGAKTITSSPWNLSRAVFAIHGMTAVRVNQTPALNFPNRTLRFEMFSPVL